MHGVDLVASRSMVPRSCAVDGQRKVANRRKLTCRRSTPTPSGGDFAAADAALLSQQLAMDRLQHSAATATLQGRIAALEAQLTQRDDEARCRGVYACALMVVGH